MFDHPFARRLRDRENNATKQDLGAANYSNDLNPCGECWREILKGTGLTKNSRRRDRNFSRLFWSVLCEGTGKSTRASEPGATTVWMKSEDFAGVGPGYLRDSRRNLSAVCPFGADRLVAESLSRTPENFVDPV